MTIKHILLPLTGEPSSTDAAICGLTLAKELGAHITVGYEDEIGPLYVTPDLAGSAVVYSMFYEEMIKVRSERKKLARQHFDHAVSAIRLPIVSAPTCQKASTMWVDDHGNDDFVAAVGALTDLVVLASPASRTTAVAWNVVEEALFHARRPALIVPVNAKVVDFSHVLVAWNGSIEAANAVSHAIGLLPPGAKVTVLQIGDLRPGRMAAQRAVDYLGWHSLETELRRVPDRSHATSQVLIEEARRAKAGCIVMGAYTHSRTREMLMGGVTDFMLRHSDYPLLMAH